VAAALGEAVVAPVEVAVTGDQMEEMEGNHVQKNVQQELSKKRMLA